MKLSQSNLFFFLHWLKTGFQTQLENKEKRSWLNIISLSVLDPPTNPLLNGLYSFSVVLVVENLIIWMIRSSIFNLLEVKSSQKDNHKVEVFPSQRQRKCTVNTTVISLKPGMNVRAVYTIWITNWLKSIPWSGKNLSDNKKTKQLSIIRTSNQRTIRTSLLHLIKMTSSR